MRETAALKAERLLRERRLHVMRVGPSTIAARIRGDHGLYTTSFDRGRWQCTCLHAASTTLCSHAQALAHVWVPNEMRDARHDSRTKGERHDRKPS
jgi:hypothetical protein